MVEYYVFMYDSAKMRPVETISEWGRGIKENNGCGESN
jgi:hypothetical protein